MLDLFHHFLTVLTNGAMLAFELVGVIVLIISGIKGVRDYITHNPKIRLNLAEGMALALEFKLGSEILRTVIVQEMSELYFIAGLIILRASLTFLIHWEIDYEERTEAAKRQQKLINLKEKEQALESAGVTADTAEQEPASEHKSGLLESRFKSTEERIRSKAREKYQNGSPAH